MRYFLVKNGRKEERNGTPKRIRNAINSSPTGTVVIVVNGVVTIIEGGYTRDAKL